MTPPVDTPLAARRRAARAARKAAAANGDIHHGTLSGYITHRCRCEPCRAASAAYQQQRRNNNPDARITQLRPWELQPLLEVTGLSLARFAARAGFKYAQVEAWQQRHMTHWQADTAAIACGYHPAMIWPTWGDDVDLDDDEEVAA